MPVILVVVDETADLPRAAQSIVKGASFDNNIICADEKVLIVVDSVADELMRLMEGQHAVKLTAAQAEQLQPVLLKNIDERGKGTVSRDWVGRDAGKIAAAIGLNVRIKRACCLWKRPLTIRLLSLK